MAVIGSRTGGTPEVIGDAGTLFDREDAVGLAAVLEPLVRNRVLRAELSRAGQRTALN